MFNNDLPSVSELLARAARLEAEGQCPVFSGRNRTGVRCQVTRVTPELSRDLQCLYFFLGENLCDKRQKGECLRERES